MMSDNNISYDDSTDTEYLSEQECDEQDRDTISVNSIMHYIMLKCGT